jgi:hypothetical protein
VWVTDQVLQFYDGDQLLRTEKRTRGGEVRKKRASDPGGRSIVKTSVTGQPASPVIIGRRRTPATQWGRAASAAPWWALPALPVAAKADGR